MARNETILALDLARTTGWALGEPGRTPKAGSVNFGESRSHEAVFDRAALWATTILDLHRPATVVWEAPLPSSFLRGRTNSDTTALLFGLPAVIGLMCYRAGVSRLFTATPSDIRNHFIGANPKRARAKMLTKARCRALGWSYSDDNAADALALWDYFVSLSAPECSSVPTIPGMIRSTRPAP